MYFINPEKSGLIANKKEQAYYLNYTPILRKLIFYTSYYKLFKIMIKI